MLFNSYPFIFLFLPITLLGFELLGRLNSRRIAIAWLIACSIAFYGVWNPLSLALILPSVAINYLLALAIEACQRRQDDRHERYAGLFLVAGIAFNLCFLGYFKYKNFFLDSINELTGSHWPLVATILPLGISFITFQKIAFLVDVRTGAIERVRGLDFLIFVFFFPQLIAGPIVHFREMVPQFGKIRPRLEASHLTVGFCLFAIGLFKKAVLADGISPYASTVFQRADSGVTLNMATAWMGTVAYTLQIYFDFSGYTDMAIGLARMFGIRLPANFNSPLKSTSIVEFWGRWHMTLTRFLTAYLYNPVVMRLTRRRVRARKPLLSRTHRGFAAFGAQLAGPTMLTMGLSGLWHGAGPTFIVWGLLHGSFLAINHGWRLWRPRWDEQRYERAMKVPGFILTFVAIASAMAIFRARTLAGSGRVLHAMAGLDGFALPQGLLDHLGAAGAWLAAHGFSAPLASGTEFAWMLAWNLALAALVFCFPNSLELMRGFEPALNVTLAPAEKSALTVSLRWPWALSAGLLVLGGLLSLNRISEFLYWQF